MAYTAIIVALAGAVMSAAMTAYGSYVQNENQQAQAKAMQRQSDMQAEAESNAAAARKAQVLYKAKLQERSMLSRQASAGVVVGEGSLLENEMAFASAAEYDSQVAAYPGVMQSQVTGYKSQLFGWQQGALASRQTSDALISGVAAGASSLASSYRSGQFDGVMKGNTPPSEIGGI